MMNNFLSPVKIKKYTIHSHAEASGNINLNLDYHCASVTMKNKTTLSIRIKR